MRTVVFGVIGSVLDGGFNKKRLNRWRPTVDIARHPELNVTRMELLYDTGSPELPERVRADIQMCDPRIEVRTHAATWQDPWDFEEVYGRAARLRPRLPAFDGEELPGPHHHGHPRRPDLPVPPGGRPPARLLQTSPPPGSSPGPRKSAARHLALHDHRPRSGPLRPHRRAVRRRAARRSALLKGGIETRNPRYNPSIERIELVASRRRRRSCSLGPTGAGKSRLARRIYELKRARHQLAGEFVRGQLRHPARRRRVSTLFGHAPRRVHRRRREPAGAAVARRTAGSCSSTRSASSGSTSRRCCCGRSRRSGSAGGRRQGGQERLPAHRRHQPRPPRARAGGPVPRGPPRPHRPVDVPPARPCASGPRTSSPTSTTSSSSARRSGRRVAMNREARARFLAFATGPGGRWRGQLPRLQRRGHPHGHAVADRTHRGGGGRRRARAARAAVARAPARRPRDPRAGGRRPGARPVRPRPARRRASGVRREPVARRRRPHVVRGVAAAPHLGQRRGSAAQVPRPVRAHVRGRTGCDWGDPRNTRPARSVHPPTSSRRSPSP
jgi:hypothetical protein